MNPHRSLLLSSHPSSSVSLSGGTLFPSLLLFLLLFPSNPLSLPFRCQRHDLPVKPDQRLAAPHADCSLFALPASSAAVHASAVVQLIHVDSFHSGHTWKERLKTLTQLLLCASHLSVWSAEGEVGNAVVAVDAKFSHVWQAICVNI